MNNTHTIDFQFPIAGTTAKDPIRSNAALIYFGIFAVGLLAGVILTFGSGSGSGGKGSSGSSSGKKSSSKDR